MNELMVLYHEQIGLHIKDLRRLVIQVFFTIAVGFSVCFLFRDFIYGLILEPIQGVNVLNEGNTQPLILTFLHVSAPLSFQMDMLLFAAAVLMSPLLFYFLWKYVQPILTYREKSVVGIFTIFSSVLTLLGCIYAYLLIIPYSLRFFTGLNDTLSLHNTQFSVDAEAYLEFFRTIFFSTLLTFQLPIMMFALLRAKVLPVRLLLTNKKYLYFALMVLIFIVVPGDISISILITVPIIVLMEVAIFLGKVGLKQRV